MPLSLAAPRALAQIVAESDCEAIHARGLDQPVNTWSSLAYVVVGTGLVLAARRQTGPARRRAALFGALVIAVGLGSLAYHGLGGAAARALHEVTILAVLAAIVLRDAPPGGRWRSRRWATLAVGPVVIAVVWPAAATAVLGAAAALLVVGQVRAWSGRPAGSRRLIAGAAVVLSAAVAVFVLTRTGAPLCAPDSMLQGHALWHGLTAVALGLWAAATWPPARGGVLSPAAPATGTRA